MPRILDAGDDAVRDAVDPRGEAYFRFLRLIIDRETRLAAVFFQHDLCRLTNVVLLSYFFSKSMESSLILSGNADIV